MMYLLYLFLSVASAAAEFDAYQMNGGLVSAVAGHDFVVLATDTRLSESYSILERRHVSSRLWTLDNGSLDELRYDDTTSYSVASTKRKKQTNPPDVWIASAGCQADCEGLKRQFRSQFRAAGAQSNSVRATALALSHELYHRRGFPYYVFCLVAGWENDKACVYAYDAIGSYEQVAVASAGTGNHLLQPILDRYFVTEDGSSKITNCPTPEVAVQRLIQAYRAVAEREIAVGDSLVLISMCKTSRGEWEIQRWTSPLKSH